MTSWEQLQAQATVLAPFLPPQETSHPCVITYQSPAWHYSWTT